jgi:hypothetical protein
MHLVSYAVAGVPALCVMALQEFKGRMLMAAPQEDCSATAHNGASKVSRGC